MTKATLWFQRLNLLAGMAELQASLAVTCLLLLLVLLQLLR